MLPWLKRTKAARLGKEKVKGKGKGKREKVKGKRQSREES